MSDRRRWTWPTLVTTLLADQSRIRGPLTRTALDAASRIIAADGVELIEWIRDRANSVDVVGDSFGHAARLRPGRSCIAGRPVAVARVGPHRDLVAARAAGERPFASTDIVALKAIATLLLHADVAGRRETASTLQRLTMEIVGSLDLDRVLLSVANAAANLSTSEVAGVFLTDGVGNSVELRMRHTVGNRTVETARLRIPRGRGIAGKVLLTGRPERVDDYATTTAITKDYMGTAIQEGTRSGLGVPLRDPGGEIIGVLAVWRRRPSVYSDEDEAVLVSLAGLAAIGLSNARHYREQLDAATSLRKIRRELEAQLQTSSEALQIHHRLTEIAAAALDLSALAEAVQEVVGGHIVIVPDRDRPPVHHPPDADGLLPPEGQARPVRDATKVAITDEPGRWVMAPIEVGEVRHGNIYAFLPHSPSVRDTVTLEQAATICALLLGHEQSKLTAADRLRSEFVWDLLDGHISGEAEGRAEALGIWLTFPARVIVLRVGGLGALARVQAWSADELARSSMWLTSRVSAALQNHSGHVVPLAHRGEELIGVLPGGDGASAPTELAEAALNSSPFPTVTLHAGISRAVMSKESLPTALREARVALSAVTPATGPAVVFDDLGLLQFLIAPAGAQELYSYAESVLGPLVDYDARHRTDLVATLDRYLDHGCNASLTARTLRLHPKSLTYRLRRIREISGLDMAIRETRLDVELALRILGPAREIQRRAASSP